jgi:hypothetical protein
MTTPQPPTAHTQLEIATARVLTETDQIDPEAAVARFGSAF